MANKKMKYNVQNTRYKIVFMGTPDFGAIVLEKFCQANMRPVLVVTAPDKPVGRKQILTPPSVKVLAEQYGISVLQPEPEQVRNTKYEIQNTNPDLIVVAAYGQILPQEILDIPKYGCLNVHPSLLPKYRGPSPIQHAILNGDKETGITIMLMDEKMDHGPVVAREKTVIGPNETAAQLNSRLGYLGAETLIDAIVDWISGNIQVEQQDERKAIYTKIIKKEDGLIDWRKPAEEIERRIRAFDPWPGTYTFWGKEKKRLKIIKAGLENDKLVIKKVQPEGKKIMPFDDFLRGNPEFIKDKKICSRILI